MSLPAPEGEFRFVGDSCYERLYYSLLPGTLSYFAAIVAVRDQPVAIERYPLSRILFPVTLQPTLLKIARVESLAARNFIGHGDHQVLLFRKRKRFERTKHARFNDDFQLLRHTLDCNLRRRSVRQRTLPESHKID
jgi:hypothetical protein